MIKVIDPAPLSWIADYLADQCRWRDEDDSCPIASEFPFGCPFEHDENGIVWCSDVTRTDWLRAINIDAVAEAAKEGPDGEHDS